MSVASPIQITPIGSVAGVAWTTPSEGGAALHVVGKLVLHSDGEGLVSLVAPEQPGWHLGQPAQEEFGPPGRRIVVVRGARQHPGRVVLRRGQSSVAEVAFHAGSETLITDMASGDDAAASADDGDWFVALGADDPGARRWCKLPRFGVVATWGENERMFLGYRLFAVCVASWTLSLVYRATQFSLPNLVPHSMQLHLMSLEEALAMGAGIDEAGSADEPPVPSGALPAPPVARIATNADPPAPADLAVFSNEATMAAEEEADD